MAVLFYPPRNSAIHPTHRCQHPMCIPTSTTAFTPTMKLTECQRNADADNMYSPIRRRIFADAKKLSHFSASHAQNTATAPKTAALAKKPPPFYATAPAIFTQRCPPFYATVSSILRNGGRHSISSILLQSPFMYSRHAFPPHINQTRHIFLFLTKVFLFFMSL